MLRKYHPIWLNTHFNTPKEFTDEAAKACAMLALSLIPIYYNRSQNIWKEVFL